MKVLSGFVVCPPLWGVLGTKALAQTPAPLPLPSYVALFNKAFQPGFMVKLQLAPDKAPENVPFQQLNLGKLKLTSGRIAACDPFITTEVRPFIQPVPVGEFPLTVAYPRVGKQGGQVAFARLDFLPHEVTRWEMALMVGDEGVKLKPGDVFGYPVDSGTGSFGDSAAFAQAFRQSLTNETVVDEWLEKGRAEGEKRGLNFFLDVKMPLANIMMFESGWGDGYYASYFGFDKEGKLTALVADFALLA